MSWSFTHYSLLITHYFPTMEPTHLSNTTPHPVMENTRRIWSAAAGFGDYGDFNTDSHSHRYHHFHHSYQFHRITGKL
jgi:hypothetical protein